MVWRDLSTLQRDGDVWEMSLSHLPSQLENQLASTRMVIAGSDRYTKRIEVGGAADYCRIVITPKAKYPSIGCRVIAKALNGMALSLNGVDHVPEQVYIQVRGGSFSSRGKLMLKAFADPVIRQDILKGYSLSHVAAQSLEKAGLYEKRAVVVLLSSYKGYQRADTKGLYLPDVKGKPDGFFLRTQSKEAVIVEIKKRRPDFAEGTAQIVQYYAQAKHCSKFKDWNIRLCLVTSKTEPTEGYELWQQWMASDKRLNVFVTDSG